MSLRNAIKNALVSNYMNGALVNAEQRATVPTPAMPQQPRVNKSNVIGSFAEMLGPSPEERVERERQMATSKAKMAGWMGLFDGLRHLGNLYYAYKGAKPQRYTDNPYQQIEANYQADRQRADELDKYKQSYAQLIYNLQRQGQQDALQAAESAAKVRWYDSKENAANTTAEQKGRKYITLKNGGVIMHDGNTGEIKEIAPEDPDYVAWLRARAKSEQQRGNAAATNAAANKTRADKYQSGGNKGKKGEKTMPGVGSKKTMPGVGSKK
ncbi:hypothetical protein L6472_06190 [Prevotella sp. E13-17]|uniref:hypothetical protein n=1 Tax=Prevotella sp. E13-17 TaxID=2913616 RepID=UPI001ED9E6EC|nr:hypothetical protein [Prevotella sp. E13-17]UKK52168.1 hypothetical protein L6472_06190 [Prevotella sp. E13-17]